MRRTSDDVELTGYLSTLAVLNNGANNIHLAGSGSFYQPELVFESVKMSLGEVQTLRERPPKTRQNPRQILAQEASE
jgi:hypothetical protein